jgi:hypothetical protein
MEAAVTHAQVCVCACSGAVGYQVVPCALSWCLCVVVAACPTSSAHCTARAQSGVWPESCQRPAGVAAAALSVSPRVCAGRPATATATATAVVWLCGGGMPESGSTASVAELSRAVPVCPRLCAFVRRARVVCVSLCVGLVHRCRRRLRVRAPQQRLPRSAPRCVGGGRRCSVAVRPCACWTPPDPVHGLTSCVVCHGVMPVCVRLSCRSKASVRRRPRLPRSVWRCVCGAVAHAVCSCRQLAKTLVFHVHGHC